MKIAHGLCALVSWLALVRPASAAESLAAGSSAAAARSGPAAATTLAARDPRSPEVVERSQAQEPVRGSSGNGSRRASAAVAATPPRDSAAALRTNASRLHSLRGPGARGRLANTSRTIGPKHGAASALTAPARTQLEADPKVPPKLPVSNTTVRTAPNLKIVPRGSTIGGPHVAGPGRLGGPPTGRTANTGISGGTQWHRRF